MSLKHVFLYGVVGNPNVGSDKTDKLHIIEGFSHGQVIVVSAFICVCLLAVTFFLLHRFGLLFGQQSMHLFNYYCEII